MSKESDNGEVGCCLLVLGIMILLTAVWTGFNASISQGKLRDLESRIEKLERGEKP